MTTQRKCVGGKNGLSIECVAKLDEQGIVVEVWFEVFDSDGKLLGTFQTLDEAEDFVEKYNPEPPSPSFRM